MARYAAARESCCWMYKCTNFLANHNRHILYNCFKMLLLDVQMY